MSKIILATTSHYRIEAFKLLGLESSAEGSSINERFEGRPATPDPLVRMLARRKAEEVAKRHSSGIVIGFDSVGWYKGSIMEKPRSKKEAYERLKSLSGKKHLFFTGIFMINIETTQSFSSVARTKVIMRKLADSEILFYLDQDLNFMTYALGYCPWEYYSATFVKRIEGSYNNLLRGIPLEIVGGLLSRIGYVPKGNR